MAKAITKAITKGENIPDYLTTDPFSICTQNVGVEHSFSSYKHLKTNQRCRLLFENRQILIIQCNMKIN